MTPTRTVTPRRTQRMSSVPTDTIRHSAHRRKVFRILAFVRRYQDCCAAFAAMEWRAFFETGKFAGKCADFSRFDGFCGVAAAQMARAQVTAMLASFVCKRQNEFRRAVHRSALDPNVKHMLYLINVRQAWHVRADVAMAKTRDVSTGDVIGAEVRRLAASLWRSIRKRHRRPNARGITPILDGRIAEVNSSKSRHADLWATFKFVGQDSFSIPLHFRAARPGPEGEPCSAIQIVPRGDNFTVRLTCRP
jgi:hypothetical protein